VIWRSLFQTIIRLKGLPVFYILRKEGERELDSRERERERVRGRTLDRRKVASVPSPTVIT